MNSNIEQLYLMSYIDSFIMCVWATLIMHGKRAVSPICLCDFPNGNVSLAFGLYSLFLFVEL